MRPTITHSLLHAMRSTLLAPFLGAMILAGCKPAQPDNNGGAQAARPTASDSQSLVTPSHLGAVAAQPGTSSTGKEIGPRRPSAGETTGPAHSNATIPVKAQRGDATASESLTVASFLERSIAAGERVQVTGTCLDQFHASGIAGPPPVSRSDWQLATGTKIVYVVGRMPAACSAGPLTLTATVAIDTTLVGGRRAPRRFLVVSR
jgi:hypothetical protein